MPHKRFPVDTRVVWSRYGMQRLAPRNPDAIGMVVWNRSALFVKVRWDGQRQMMELHPDFVEAAPMTAQKPAQSPLSREPDA